MIDGRRSRRASPEQLDRPQAPVPPSVETGERAVVRFERLRQVAPGRRLAAHGVTANQVTVVGLVVAAATGVTIGLGQFWIGAGLLTAGGLMDTLDGAVAKAAGSSSRRGAFLDSVTDRVADAFMFGGVAWYLAGTPRPELAVVPFAILAVANVISYLRAKAESFGWDARGGLMERAERLIALGLALVFHVVLVPLLLALLGLCVVTAGQRFVRIWRQATAEQNGEPLPTRPATAAALAAWRPARVESRWRAWREARVAGSPSERRPVVVGGHRRRRAAEPLSTRVRSVLAADRERVGRSGRQSSNAAERLARRRREGAASALRRRFGAGR